jgi:hypothetical protein
MFEGRVNFHLELAPASGSAAIFVQNPAPKKGELPRYPGYDHDQSYAQVAFLPGDSGAADVLLISGTTAEATAAAGSFLANEKEVEQALRKIGIRPDGPARYFEFLMRVTAFVGGATNWEVAAARDCPAAGARH